ncbi:HEAT repeat domain-containing protein [Lysinibacillus piscis]|uniref:HEAT repeat domain-containing protein n=1 Tax=Lysinibacillus piscis TaxID=2518931 RepID=A0ABQ5NN05_9BACI|nr:HEAT repeat domain-containing protein [Lysinibacillus sp. KH24]GLC89757.1 hypothetical protein LYSBPC_28840 [Lysinibacillus sp. KH24]
MIELSIPFLLSAILVMLTVLAVFIVYILFQRSREVRFNKARAVYLQTYSQAWYAFLFQDAEFSIAMIPRGKAQVAAVEEIFSSYLKNVINAEVTNKIQNSANQYLKKFYAKDLTSRFWGVRMNALYRIADFRINELLDEALQFEQKKISKEEYFQLLKIYSILQPEIFLKKIKEARTRYSESEYRRLFILLSDDVFNQMFDDFYNNEQNIQLAIIDTTAVKRNMQFIENLKRLLNDESDEIKIRALKGLYEIGIVDEIDTYIPFVTSNVWEIRLMVAKIFKYAPLTYTYPYLEQLLQDENWWVRSQAAKTIAEEREGVAKLQQFIAHADDQYAIEMVQETIVRKQGNR